MTARRPAKRQKMAREISAGGVVYNKKTKKILLIKDSYGRWAFPKGLIDKGETTKQAALREVEEETGLKNLKIVKKLGSIKYIYTLKGRKIFKIVTFFLMETDRIRLKPQWEIRGAKWFEPRAALERIDYANSKSILRAGLKAMS